MKKEEKRSLVQEMREKLKEGQGTFLVDYKGLSVASLSRIKRELRNSNAELKVVKNTLLKIASEGTTTQSLAEKMKGPTAVAIARGDAIQTAKVLVAMAKEFQDLKLRAGQISGKPMDEDGIRRLSEIPSREVLLSRAFGTMQAVPASFVRVLAGVIGKFLNVLKAIEAQRA